MLWELAPSSSLPTKALVAIRLVGLEETYLASADTNTAII
jgi:hypothetical protein